MIDFRAALNEATESGKVIGFLNCLKRMGEEIIAQPNINAKQLYKLLCAEVPPAPPPAATQNPENPL